MIGPSLNCCLHLRITNCKKVIIKEYDNYTLFTKLKKVGTFIVYLANTVDKNSSYSF